MTFKVCGRGWLCCRVGVPQAEEWDQSMPFPSSPEALKVLLLLLLLGAPMLVCARSSLPAH